MSTEPPFRPPPWWKLTGHNRWCCWPTLLYRRSQGHTRRHSLREAWRCETFRQKAAK